MKCTGVLLVGVTDVVEFALCLAVSVEPRRLRIVMLCVVLDAAAGVASRLLAGQLDEQAQNCARSILRRAKPPAGVCSPLSTSLVAGA
jgi:hypothetical protein